MGKTKKVVPLVKRSQANVLAASRDNQKLTDKVYNIAHRAPPFTKKDKQVRNSKTIRTNRCVTSHAWKILSSAASANVAAVVENEAAQLRMFPELEAPSAPGLMTFSKGFVNFLEQFLVSYTAAVLSRSIALKDAMNKHKKLSYKAVSVAAKTVDSCIWSSHGISPSVYRAPALMTNKKKTAKKTKQTTEEEADPKAIEN